jgi:hypothetical protein
VPNPRTPWVDLVDWPGYQINRLGQVKSLSKVDSLGRLWPELILKVSSKYGRCVVFRRDGQSFTTRVSRLVLMTFVGPSPPGRPLACHKDDNVRNNKLENLYWGNKSSNQIDAMKNGRLTFTKDRNKKISDSLKRFYAGGGKCR